jgi:hypothetical protein
MINKAGVMGTDEDMSSWGHGDSDEAVCKPAGHNNNLLPPWRARGRGMRTCPLLSSWSMTAVES